MERGSGRGRFVVIYLMTPRVCSLPYFRQVLACDFDPAHFRFVVMIPLPMATSRAFPRSVRTLLELRSLHKGEGVTPTDEKLSKGVSQVVLQREVVQRKCI